MNYSQQPHPYQTFNFFFAHYLNVFTELEELYKQQTTNKETTNMKNPEEIQINGATYVLKGTETPKMALQSKTDKRMVIVRSHSAGVFYGYAEKREGMEITLSECKRIYAWYGAATLSQLAVEGVKRPSECKFTMAVPEELITQAIEIIPLTQQALDSLESVPIWKV